MNWSITTIIPLIASLIYGGLFVIVILSVPLNRLRRIFVFYLFSMVVWSLSALMTLSGVVEVLPWFRTMIAAPIMMGVSIFFFVQDLFAKRRPWAPLVVWYALIAILVTLFSNSMIETAYLTPDFTLTYEFKPLIYVVALPGYALIFFSMAELINGVRQTDNPIQRNRLQYLIIGLAITITASIVNFTPLGVYPIDIAANGITAILIAYSIMRYQLLEIRVVLRLGLVYTLMTTLLGTLYYFFIYLSIYRLHLITEESIFSLSLAIAFLTALVLTPLREWFQQVIDRIFYRQRYDAGLMLERLSEATASLLHLEEVTSLILDELTQTLHIQYAAIYVRKNGVGNFRQIASHNLSESTPTTMDNDHPIVRWLSTRDKVIDRFELNTLPAFRGMWKEERAALEMLAMDLFIPLKSKGQLVGLLAVGPKRSEQEYSQDDQRTLITLGNQIAVAIENARLYEELESTFVETVVALANAIDLRDTYTSDHSQQIASLARATARQLQLAAEEIEAIYWGGLLHDIGKIGIPDSILQKPAALDDEEWAKIREHPQRGAELVARIHKLQEIAPIIEASHERFDGSGYPFGKKGEEIPIGARIVGVVDSFSAMIDERPYKPPKDETEALKEIEDNAGRLYDPEVVDAFFKIIKSEYDKL